MIERNQAEPAENLGNGKHDNDRNSERLDPGDARRSPHLVHQKTYLDREANLGDGRSGPARDHT